MYFNDAKINFRCLEQIQQPGHVAGEEDDEEEALATGNKVLGEGKEPEETDTHQHGHEIDNRDTHDTQRMDDGGETQYQQDIHDIGADDIADGNSRTALIGCHDTRGELGQRGTTSYDGKTNHTLAHTITMGDILGGFDKEVATKNQTGQTQNDESNVLPETGIVARLLDGRDTQLFFVLRQKTLTAGHLEGNEHKAQEGYEQDDTVLTTDLITPEVG